MILYKLFKDKFSVLIFVSFRIKCLKLILSLFLSFQVIFEHFYAFLFIKKANKFLIDPKFRSNFRIFAWFLKYKFISRISEKEIFEIWIFTRNPNFWKSRISELSNTCTQKYLSRYFFCTQKPRSHYCRSSSGYPLTD